jgi:hypothetical protein
VSMFFEKWTRTLPTKTRRGFDKATIPSAMQMSS